MGRLDEYLDRIGHVGAVRPDLATLRALHRAHSIAIPYEDVDVQLGVRVGLEIDSIFDKLVTRRRGGWCYEMNGLLHWALVEIGFDAVRLVGGVPGENPVGDSHLGSHLVVVVALDGQNWLVDVGLGAGMIEPIPLTEGEHRVGARTVRLEATGADAWRFHHHEGVRPPMFDFVMRSDEAWLGRVCDTLQDDPASIFRQNLIVNRFDADGVGVHALLGRSLWQPGRPMRVLADADELVGVLGSVFGIVQPGLAALWPTVEARHAELFPDG